MIVIGVLFMQILVNTLEEPECKEYVVNEWCGIKQTLALIVGAILECQDTAVLPSLLSELSAICRMMVATVRYDLVGVSAYNNLFF